MDTSTPAAEPLRPRGNPFKPTHLNIDWPNVQKDIEAGAGLRATSRKYGVPVGTIVGRRRKWNVSGKREPVQTQSTTANQPEATQPDAPAHTPAETVSNSACKELVDGQIRDSSAFLGKLGSAAGKIEEAALTAKTPKDLGILIKAYETMIKTARLAFPELSRVDSRRAHIRVGVVKQLVIGNTPPEPAEVVDVESTKIEDRPEPTPQ